MQILQKISLQGFPKISEAAVCAYTTKQLFLKILENLKIHWNAPEPELLFILQPSTLLKKRRRYIQFSMSFAKLFRNTFIKENILPTDFERRILQKMANFNSITDISFLMYVTKIFYICYFFQEKFWECFNVQP